MELHQADQGSAGGSGIFVLIFSRPKYRYNRPPRDILEDFLTSYLLARRMKD